MKNLLLTFAIVILATSCSRNNYELSNINEDIKANSTIDSSVQKILDDELSSAVKKFKAKAVGGLVMNANNGEIIAISSLNRAEEAPTNIITSGNYELGSVFKPITVAAGFDTGKINEKMTFDTTSPMKIDRFTITDFMPQNRPLTASEVLVYSSNIGASKIAQKVGAVEMYGYYNKLNFFKPLDVEVSNKYSPVKLKGFSEANLAAASFGHGIAVSPLHVAAAMSAVVNGGLYYQPTLNSKGYNKKPIRVFSKKTSDIMKSFLRLVVTDGTGTKANVGGYMVGGKTGTAAKILPNGRYSDKDVVSTFVGAFPMNKPEYLVMIVLDEPKGSTETSGFNTAGWNAAPTAGNIIAKITPVLGVKKVD